MRITNQMKLTQLLTDLNRLENDVFVSQKALSTGKEIQKPSDDPARARTIMQLLDSQARRTQNEKNIDNAVARASFTETQLTHTDDLLVQARTVATQGANAATSDADRKSLAERIDQILHELVATANSRHEDQYIFGGYNTQEAPYSLVTDPDTGEVIQVQDLPNNMDGKVNAIVADGEQVQVNIPGTEVYQTGDPGDDGDMFQILIDLRDALSDGIDNDPDQEPPVLPTDPQYTEAQYDSSGVISGALDRIDTAADRVRGVITRIGGSVKRLNDIKNRHQDLAVKEDEHLSQVQDADMTKWISKYQMQQIALQQAMQVGSQVLNTSLVSFIQ